MSSIIVYKKTNCPWAAAVMAYLTTKGISFEQRDIYKNEAFLKEVEAATGQSKSPTVSINGTWLKDASVEQVAAETKKQGIDR